MSLYAAVPMFVWYLRALFPGQFDRRIALFVISALFGLSCLWMIALPMELAAASLRLVERASWWWRSTSFTALRAHCARAPQSRETARLIALGTLLLVVATINDVLHVNRIIHTFVAEHFWHVQLRLCAGLRAGREQRPRRRHAESLASELDRKNHELSRMDRMKDEFPGQHQPRAAHLLSGIIGLARSAAHPAEPARESD